MTRGFILGALAATALYLGVAFVSGAATRRTVVLRYCTAEHRRLLALDPVEALRA